MKWNVDDIPKFIAAVDRKGISAAADHLGLPKSSVSRSITRLEDALGVRLLERNSRNVRITSEGDVFYQRCLLIMDEVEQANAEMSGLVALPTGKLVVSLPMAFSREVFSPHIPLFISKYPDIELEVIITSKDVDIIRDHIDVALMIGSLIDSDLVAKKLMDNQLVWVASPEYLKEHDISIKKEDIASHVQVCETRYGKQRHYFKSDCKKEYLDLSRSIKINDPIVVKDAVVEGCGISILPLLYCQKNLNDGSLVHILPTVCSDQVGSISAVYPSRRHISNKVRVFIDFLSEILKLNA